MTQDWKKKEFSRAYLLAHQAQTDRELSLKEIQNILLETFREFDRLCRDNGIRYCVMWGTLLGAVRHQGFIPWDDDIDIFMTRENYEKLLKLNFRSEKWEIVSYASHDGYYYPYLYGNAVDRRTVMVARHLTVCTGKGLSIDLVPLDHIAADPEERKKTLRELTYCRKMLAFLYSRRFDAHQGWKQRIKTMLAKSLFWLDENKYLMKMQDIALRSDKACAQDGVYCNFSIDVPRFYACADFDDPVEMPFEDMTVYAPRHHDALLTEIYGDYMTIPAEGDRDYYNHHMQVFYRKPQASVQAD